MLNRVYLHLEAEVEADSPLDAAHDVYTLVRTQLYRIPVDLNLKLKTITGQTLEKKPPQRSVHGTLFVSLILALMFLPFALLDAWALTYAWKWFIVPTFHLPQLGVLQLVGIALVVRQFHRREIPTDEKFQWSKFLLQGILNPIMFLGLAALVHWLMLRYG